jgi:hypothetical protein
MSNINISSSYGVSNVRDLTRKLEAGTLTVPSHQRGDNVWKKKLKSALIDSILRGAPINMMTFREKISETGAVVVSIEDGLQRISNLLRFTKNCFPDGQKRFFKDFDEVTKEKLMGYSVATNTYSNATDTQAVEIFDNLNSGSNLTNGARLASQAHNSPLVDFVKKQLLTPGVGFHDRVVPFWGPRDEKTNDGKDMLNAFAIVVGLAYGPDYITCEGVKLHKIMALDDFKPDEIIAKLEILVSIWEKAHARHPKTTKTVQNAAWKLTNLNGYIVYSLFVNGTIDPEHTPPTPTAMAKTWEDFIVESRLHPEVIKNRLHLDDAKAGGHTDAARWRRGWLRIFHPEVTVVPRAQGRQRRGRL